MSGMSFAGAYAIEAFASAVLRASFRSDMPAATPAGTTREADVAEVTSKDVTGIPPTVADMALLNPVPVKVTESPDLIARGRRLVRESNFELAAAQPDSIESEEQTPPTVVALTEEVKPQADSPQSPKAAIKMNLRFMKIIMVAPIAFDGYRHYPATLKRASNARIDSQKRLPKIGWKLGGLDSLRHNKKYFIGGHFSPPGERNGVIHQRYRPV